MRSVYLCILISILTLPPTALAVTQFNLTNGSASIVIFNGTPGNTTWTAPADVTEAVLINVAGGGGGGDGTGGGGGAGGVQNLSITLAPGTIYNITVGSGGAGSSSPSAVASNGTFSLFGNSSFSNISAGGGGGTSLSTSATTAGMPGGSGGGGHGAGSADIGGTGNTPVMNPSQGYNGGNGSSASKYGGGGGGGAGGIGGNGNTSHGGAGGNCVNVFNGITTNSYAGGGGGGINSAGIAGLGGCGIGGNGSITDAAVGGYGVNETGSGGGGGGYATTGGSGGRGGNGIVILYYTTTTSESPISANFTQSPNPSSTGQSVSFTDTSSGTVVTRNWTFFHSTGSFNDRNISPNYTWSSSGTYPVFLNVTNTTGAWSNTSQSHTVTNVSTLYPQDIWMEGAYMQTFFVHNSDNVGIGNVTITSGNYSATTTSTGYANITFPFGSYLVTFTSSGYTTRQISYVFDSDASHDVELAGVVVPATPSQSTWWTPHQVQVVILDTFGQPLDMVNVTAAYNQSSMPESWLNDLYGLNTNISTQMVNRSLYLHGDTGSDGEITFPMLGTIKYDIWVTSIADGIDNYHTQAYPSDDYLNIYVQTNGSQLPTQGNSTYSALNQSRVYFTEPDINNITMCVDYRDFSGSTTSLTVNWTFVNNHTVANSTTLAPGTSLNTLCYTLRNVRGTQVWWGYNATRAVA